MSDETAFIRAILDDPDDDAPRLVFADWIDEHGEPARAEFIRVQCRLAGTDEGRPAYTALRAREAELLERHGPAWREPFAALGPEVWVEFTRGFVSTVLDASAADDLLVRRLAATPLLETLDISRSAVTDDGLRHLAGLTNLRALYALDCDVSLAGLRHLAGLPRLFDVTATVPRADVDQFRRERAEAFAGWPAERKRRAAMHVVRAAWPNGDPTDLHFHNRSVGDDLLSLLPAFPETRTIRLFRFDITDDGLRHLAMMPCLEELALIDTPVADLSGLAEMTALRRLEFSGRLNLTDDGATALESLVGLEELSLAFATITDATLDRLARLPRLWRLRVDGCEGVTAEAVRRLADARPGIEVDVSAY